jgi:hypothetical protein
MLREVLEELKELFGSAFGPAVEGYGRSPAERLCEDDEGLVSAVKHRFEEGRARSDFRRGSQAALPWSQRKAQLGVTVRRPIPVVGPRPFASRSWSVRYGRVAS